MSSPGTKMHGHQRLRLAGTFVAACLSLLWTTALAWSQTEETRLTQPTLEPIPPAPSEVEEEPRPEPPADRANILGMTVVESDVHRALVTDVAMMSPAEEAGVREGDQIRSFAGFRGRDYEQWLERVRRIVRDTPDGTMLPMVIVRNGEEQEVEVRTLVSRADPPPIARPPRFVPPAGTGIEPPGQVLFRGQGVAIDENRFIRQAFVDGVGRPTDRAIARLHWLGAPQSPTGQRVGPGDADRPADRTDATSDQTAPVGPADVDSRDPAVPQTSDTGDAASGSPAPSDVGHTTTLIGLAGFQNRPQGLFVTVEVGALQPGNYLVAIVEPDALLGRTDDFGRDAQAITPAEPVERQPRSTPREGLQPAEQNFQPTSGQQPTEADRPAEEPLGQTPRRRAGEGATAEGVQSRPVAPTHGEATRTRAAQQPNAETARQAPAATGQPAGGPAARFEQLAAAGLGAPVGMLAIDPDGTGRLQETVQRVQVADVVGQAIVIYAQADPRHAEQPDDGIAHATRSEQPQDAEGQPPSVPGTPPTTTPVAAGLIQYMTAGVPNAAEATAPQGGTTSPQQPGTRQPQQPGIEQQPAERQD